MMFKKYQLPISIFVVFEKLQCLSWSSKSFQPNSFFIYSNHNWLYGLNIFFKNEVFMNNSMLLEVSAIDSKNFNKFNKNVDFFLKKNRIILFYVFYFLTIKLKIILLTSNNPNLKSKVTSIDFFYKSASWLERECSEMFGVYFNNKKDIRRLLLDYSKVENPMLKDFPSEGYNDVFYSFFEEQVTFTKNDVVEL